MTQPAHLTGEQVARFRSRKLAPAELLDVDSHISACEACRDLLYTDSHATVPIAALRADFDGHLDYDGIVACASGSPTAQQREHLEICKSCRADVDDLRGFQEELRGTPRPSAVIPIDRGRGWRVPLTIAAGVVLVGVSVWSLRRSQPSAPEKTVATVTQPQPAEAPLAPAERQALDLAVADHRLERAPILDRLITRQGTLLGPDTESKRFDLTSPLSTAVEMDRPVFHWKALAGATSYVVAVFDERFESVATSPAVTGLEWQPAQPLPRGRVLNWQVTANIGGETVHAPVPPAPEAHFSVIAADAEAQIEAARHNHPGNHLLLAALYSRAGDLDDAARELGALDPATARPYLDSLKRMR